MDGRRTISLRLVRCLCLIFFFWARTADSQTEPASGDVDPAAAQIITAVVDAFFNPPLPSFSPDDVPQFPPPGMPNPNMPDPNLNVNPATAIVPDTSAAPTGPPKEVPYKKAPPETAEVLIPKYDEWQYLVGEHPASRDFTKVDFVAAGWKTGRVGIGFGNDNDVTKISKGDLKGSTVVYLRHEFQFESPAREVHSLGLVINFKDGFVAFLNGHEIARRMVLPPGVGKNAKKVSPHEAAGYEYFQLTEAKQFLVKGKNLLSIEGHLADIASDDLTVDPYLVLNKNAPKPGAKSASAKRAGK